jgi:uncharacterized protein (TIRG00374 family)
MWALQRLSMRTERWTPVITSNLGGQAFGRIVPGGAAAAGALQFQMLVKAGIPKAAVVSGLTASSLLTFAALLATPIFALPGILGGAPVDRGLKETLYIGLGVLGVMLAGGALLLFTDGPLRGIARFAERVLERVRHRPASAPLPQRVLKERDQIKTTFGERWWESLLFVSGKWLLDYLTLIAMLRAVGADPQPSLVLLAYCAAQILGQLPITPGGLGLVEVGLSATLALAGVPGGDAVLATLAYRLVSFWLPIPAGLVAYVVHRHRYGEMDDEEEAEEQQEPVTPAPV